MQHWVLAYLISSVVLWLLFIALMVSWENMARWRPWLIARHTRWLRHGGLQFCSLLLVRLMFPLFSVVLALKMQQKGVGILNQKHVPLLLGLFLSVLALDFVMYLQHRLLHRYRWLWRLHQVHHMDKQLDVSTGLRFHPLEAVFTQGAKIIGIAFFGVPAIAVFIYETWYHFALSFTHINVLLPPRVERWLRYFMVTPGMHRIHHSDFSPETNSNFGFGLTWWDKLFGTYRAYAQSGDRKLLLGLTEYRAAKYQTVENMLLLPFNPKHLKMWPKKRQATKFKLYDEPSLFTNP